MSEEEVRWPEVYAAGISGPFNDNDGLQDSEPVRFGVLQTLSNFRSRPMEWMWQDIVPIAACVIFAGQGGVSKSTFAITMAGKVTKGLLPGALAGQPADVLYVSHEDPIEQAVLPRAQVNEVDLERFHVFGIGSKTSHGVAMPKFPEDLAALEEKIEEVGAKLVIIDPLLSAMAGGRDPNSNVDVRELIDPLNQLAQRLDITIIGIAHINKTVTSARTAVTGSAAWSDATRATLLFAMDDPDPQMPFTEVVFGSTKGNYARNGMNYKYRLWSENHIHDNGEVGTVPKVEFLGHSDRTVADVLASGNEDRRETNLKFEIRDFIEDQSGAVGLRDVYAEFPEQKQDTMRQTLSRMVKRGMIDSPERGWYQANKYRKP